MAGKGDTPRPVNIRRYHENYDAIFRRDDIHVANQGWRFFHCEDCEHRWKEATRDWRSPSGENCPRCGEWWFPYHAEADASLKVDANGNLH